MKLSVLLQKTEYDVLVLQNIGDEVTSTPLLLEELREIPDVQLEIFDGVDHANMILHPDYKNRYMQAISTLLMEEK
jgi:pimeloyl-ACP methyl ester carboxylesterase